MGIATVRRNCVTTITSARCSTAPHASWQPDMACQILVADSTAGLLSGVHLVNLGPRRLRDLPKPIAIFQLSAPGLRADFPSLRTIDSSTETSVPPLVG